jgi:hypothetical protein
MSTIYNVTVTRDGRWWMIDIPELDGLTQARRLEDVEKTAREYIAVTTDVPLSSVQVQVTSVEAAGLNLVETKALAASMRSYRDALDRALAELYHSAAMVLTKADVPVRDVSSVLGVSHQRVSQLTAPGEDGGSGQNAESSHVSSWVTRVLSRNLEHECSDFSAMIMVNDDASELGASNARLLPVITHVAAVGAIGELRTAVGINTAVATERELHKLATGMTASFEGADDLQSGSLCRHAPMLTVRATGHDRIDIDVVDALFGTCTFIEDEAAAEL